MEFTEEIARWIERLSGDRVVVSSEDGGLTMITCNDLRILCIGIDLYQPFEMQPGVIHVWEDQWHTRRETVQGRIKSALGMATRIHGRETQVVKLNQPEAHAFIGDNHLLPSVKGKHKFGLIHRGELVTGAVFSKPCPVHRKGKEFQSVELMRFCHLNGKTVIGGLTKLLSHLFKEVNPDDIMTYVDREWSQSNAFEKMGFTHDSFSEPAIFWIHPSSFERVYPFKAKSDDQMKADGYLQFENHGSEKLILLRP
jgi:hypothetical protein